MSQLPCLSRTGTTADFLFKSILEYQKWIGSSKISYSRLLECLEKKLKSLDFPSTVFAEGQGEWQQLPMQECLTSYLRGMVDGIQNEGQAGSQAESLRFVSF